MALELDLDKWDQKGEKVDENLLARPKDTSNVGNSYQHGIKAENTEETRCDVERDKCEVPNRSQDSAGINDTNEVKDLEDRYQIGIKSERGGKKLVYRKLVLRLTNQKKNQVLAKSTMMEDDSAIILPFRKVPSDEEERGLETAQFEEWNRLWPINFREDPRRDSRFSSKEIELLRNHMIRAIKLADIARSKGE
ncbi:2576_t:CDS:2, partial [Dentiscutata heterogama]